MESTPDLLQSETVSSAQTPSLMVAETNFFNQQNQDYWHRTDLSHLRPYDFPYVRALLQQEPCDTLSPEDIKHKEQVCTSIQVVSRAYEEKYLREPIGKERACTHERGYAGKYSSHGSGSHTSGGGECQDAA